MRHYCSRGGERQRSSPAAAPQPTRRDRSEEHSGAGAHAAKGILVHHRRPKGQNRRTVWDSGARRADQAMCRQARLRATHPARLLQPRLLRSANHYFASRPTIGRGARLVVDLEWRCRCTRTPLRRRPVAVQARCCRADHLSNRRVPLDVNPVTAHGPGDRRRMRARMIGAHSTSAAACNSRDERNTMQLALPHPPLKAAESRCASVSPWLHRTRMCTQSYNANIGIRGPRRRWC